MVGIKRIRTITGIGGLVAVSFLSGVMLSKNYYQEKLDKQEMKVAVAEVNLSLEHDTNQALMKREGYMRSNYFRKTLRGYTQAYININLSGTDLACEYLEKAIEQEIYETEDFIDSLEDRKFPEELVGELRTNFYNLRGAFRMAIDLEKKKSGVGKPGQGIIPSNIFSK